MFKSLVVLAIVVKVTMIASIVAFATIVSFSY